MSAVATKAVLETMVTALGAMLASALHQRMQLRRLQAAQTAAERTAIIAEMRKNLDNAHKQAMALLDADIADG